jgi:hypothetical protein
VLIPRAVAWSSNVGALYVVEGVAATGGVGVAATGAGSLSLSLPSPCPYPATSVILSTCVGFWLGSELYVCPNSRPCESTYAALEYWFVGAGVGAGLGGVLVA